MDMEPAKTIIEYLGGAKSAAEIVRKHPSRIYRWAYPSTKREGCDGIIPLKDQRVILEFCQGVGIDLRREDFFCSDRLRSILQSNESKSPASSSVGDDAGASVTPPAQDGAPAEVSSSHAIKGACETGAQQRAETALRPTNHSNSPEVLPSGEAVARCEVRQRATATNSGEAVR